MSLRRKGLVPDITIPWTSGRHEGNDDEQRLNPSGYMIRRETVLKPDIRAYNNNNAYN